MKKFVTTLVATTLVVASAIAPAAAQTCTYGGSCTYSPPPPAGQGSSCTVSVSCTTRR